jgi:hypothetical protein
LFHNKKNTKRFAQITVKLLYRKCFFYKAGTL